jgi:hypothetical protein
MWPKSDRLLVVEPVGDSFGRLLEIVGGPGRND